MRCRPQQRSAAYSWVDPLLLADTADSPDANIERHRLSSSRYANDAYTDDESHLSSTGAVGALSLGIGAERRRPKHFHIAMRVKMVRAACRSTPDV
jgi:hypothetical protein